MNNTISPESSGALEKNQAAEEWRLLGERLRTLSPQVYRQLFAVLVMSLKSASDDHDITKSYFVT